MIKNNPLWSFFASVKLAIVLLILIALASILGTLIPQQELADPFINRFNPAVARILSSLQLFNIFHSPWFMILMALLAVNLTVCSLTRFPQAWARFRHKHEPDRDDLLDAIPPDRVVIKDASHLEETNRLERVLRKRGGVLRKDAPDRSYLYVEKGSFSHLAVYCVHLSILIMMAGVTIGLLMGFEGHMNILEGKSSSVLSLKGSRSVKTLDFAVRCDRFFMDVYETGAPKTYRSDLTFMQNGRAVRSSSVLVNHPVSFAGMRFYQATYGMVPGGEQILAVLRHDEKIKEVTIAVGMEIDLSEKTKATMIRVEENLMGMGPAVKLSIQSPAGVVQFWVFEAIEQIVKANPGIIENVPLFNPGAFAPYTFLLTQKNHLYYTGLKVTHDPGTPIVAVGAAFMMLGLMMVFFRSYRQIWIRLENLGDKTRISITGKSNRDPVGLNREIRKWVDAAAFNRGDIG